MNDRLTSGIKYGILNANDLHLTFWRNFMKRFFSLFCAVLLFAGCAPQRAATDGRLTVYTSFYAMEDFAKTVGGDLITLTNLVPAGTEAHDWEPGPRDLAGLEQADVFLYNSDDMEHWVDSLEDQLEKKEILVVETADGLEDDADDPHVAEPCQCAHTNAENLRRFL